MSGITKSQFNYLAWEAGEGRSPYARAAIDECRAFGWVDDEGLTQRGRAVYERAKLDPPRSGGQSRAIRDHPFKT
jgi:hypothetical protein